MAVTKLSSREFNRADVFKSDSGRDTAVAQRSAALHVPNLRSDRDALIAALVHNHDGATRIVSHFSAYGYCCRQPLGILTGDSISQAVIEYPQGTVQNYIAPVLLAF